MTALNIREGTPTNCFILRGSYRLSPPHDLRIWNLPNKWMYVPRNIFL